jgi:hypothetical protein
MEPDDVIPFLTTVMEANYLKSIVQKCPGLVDPVLMLMFGQIEMFGDALVALCQMKDMRVISVMVDIIQKTLAEETISDQLLRAILALIASSESPPFDPEVISGL